MQIKGCGVSMTKKIALTHGQTTIVDDEDFDFLNQYTWRAEWNPTRKSYYAVMDAVYEDNNPCVIYMHDLIMARASGNLVIEEVEIH